MKNRHIEATLQGDQLDPSKRARFFDQDPVFKSFWEICLEKSGKTKDLKKVSSVLSEYTETTWNIRKTFDEFHVFLKDVPLVIALRHWVEGVVTDSLIGKRGISEIKKLLEHDLIPLSLPNGSLVTLRDVAYRGHQSIIEDIRCVQVWTQTEKENLVFYYIRFSRDLAKYTFDYVSPGYDPDRKITETRQIPYEVFYFFIQFLSERDALLSKLLYFGAPSMEGVLSLKSSAIDQHKCSISFEEKEVWFPKHIIQSLLLYAKENENPRGLVFSNLRGEEVERAHLNQSFARASERMPQKRKITPGSLLRFSTELGNVCNENKM
jgi:hypothetical protein